MFFNGRMTGVSGKLFYTTDYRQTQMFEAMTVSGILVAFEEADYVRQAIKCLDDLIGLVYQNTK